MLGPRLGGDLPAVRSALESGDFEELGDGRLRAAGHELGPDDLLVERAQEHGWAHSDRISVGFDLELDDELRREGRVYDLVHAVERAAQGPRARRHRPDRSDDPDGDLLPEYEERIKAETLAVEIRAGPELDLEQS